MSKLARGWTRTSLPARESGGQAQVFQVERDPSDGNLYALKRVRNIKRLERFRREVTAMQRLRAEGLTVLPEVVAHDLDAARPWFVMPWYEESLEETVVDGRFREAPERAIALLVKIAEAFSAVHAQGYAHRDGKPANILLRGPEVALADYGLCLQADDDAERLTAGDEAVGSRLYIAPENESGVNEEIDQRPADFYAFAKILWGVLAGRQPPARETQLEPGWRLEEILDDPRYGSLHSLQERLLAQNTADRLADWRIVLKELEVGRGRFHLGGADTPEDEEVFVAARRLGSRPHYRSLLAQRTAAEENETWCRDRLAAALADGARAAGAEFLARTTQQSLGALNGYVASENNPLGNLVNGSEQLRSRLPEGIDPHAPNGGGGTASAAGYYVEAASDSARTRAAIMLFTSAQQDGIWLVAAPVISRGTEWFVPEDMLDGACRIDGPHPWRLEQTIDAARRFSSAAFKDFLPMLRRYIEAIEEGIEPFDPAVWETTPAFRTTSWKSFGDLLPPRGHHAAAAIDGAIWVLGGQTADGVTDRVDVLDVRGESMRPGRRLTAPRLQLQAVVLDGSVVVIGGTLDNQHSSLVESFDGAVWVTRAPLRIPRSDFGAVTGPDGAIYVVGGLDGRVLSDVERYVPDEDRWEEIAPMRQARRGFAIGVDSDHIYVAGGRIHDGGVFTHEVEIFDFKTGAWTDGPTMPTSRAWCAGTVAPDGNFYVLGGHRQGDPGRGYVKTAEAFSPTTQSWRELDPLRVSRASLAVVAVGKRVFTIGGDGDGAIVPLVEELEISISTETLAD